MPCYLENQEKLGNLKIDQKIRKFHKIDCQSAIQRTSCQYREQNVRNSGLELHACDFSCEFAKMYELLFNFQKSTCLSSYHKITRTLKFFIAKFLIFGFSDLMLISSKVCMYSILKLAYKFC